MIYVLYLSLSLRWTITLIMLPLIYLIFHLDSRARLILLFSFALVDYEQHLMGFSFYNHLSSAKLSSVTLLLNQKLEFSFFAYPILFLLALAIIYLLAHFLTFLRKKKSYYVIIFYLLLIVFLIELFTYFFNQASFFSSYAIILINLLTRKVWLIFLISNELMFGNSKWSDVLEGILSPALSVRENLIMDHYKLEKKKAFYIGVKLSLVLIFIICAYDQLKYQLTGKVFGFVWINDWVYNLICQNVNSPSSIQIINSTSFLDIWKCRGYSHVFIGIIKHIIIDGFYFVIPLFMMGYSIHLPFKKFYKANKFTHFLFGLFYYYGLNIYRIFIIEFYKIIQALFKRRSKMILPLATLLGVYLGGILWHFVEDYLFVYSSTQKSITSFVFSPSFQAYFIGLSIACYISEKFRLKIFNHTNQGLRILFYLFVITTLRYYFSGYFIDGNSLFLKLQLILKSIGLTGLF